MEERTRRVAENEALFRQVNEKVVGSDRRPDETFEVVVLLNEGELHWFRLGEMRRIGMADPEMNRRLSAALSRLAAGNPQITKGLDLIFDGEGRRQVSFAYVLGSPIWRTAA